MSTTSTEMTKESLAEFMHHKYEAIAIEEGWQTQKKTRGSFKELPEANKKVMLRLAQEIINIFEPKD